MASRDCRLTGLTGFETRLGNFLVLNEKEDSIPRGEAPRGGSSGISTASWRSRRSRDIGIAPFFGAAPALARAAFAQSWMSCASLLRVLNVRFEPLSSRAQGARGTVVRRRAPGRCGCV